MLLLMHCYPDGRVAGFWTDLEDDYYRAADADMQTAGNLVMDEHTDEDWDDVVAELRDNWTAEGGWAAIEDFPDMSAEEAYILFFGEE